MSRVLVNGQDVNYTSDFPEMTYDKWKALPEDLRPNYTVITDRDYTREPIDNSVSVTADGVKTCSQLLNELFALIDKSKITRNTCIRTQHANGNYTMYSLSSARPSSDVYYFVTHQVANQKLNHYSIRIASSNSMLDAVENGVYSDYSSDVESSGYVYTLYYNIISTGLDAEIPAENVIYGDSNVKDALDELNDDVVEYYDYAVSMYSNSGVSPFTYYNSVNISDFASGKKILSAQPIVTSSAQRAIVTINNTQTTAYIYGTDSSNIVLRVTAKKA